MKISNRSRFFGEKEGASRPPGRGRGLRRFWRGQRGSISVEFGIIAPLLILILCGIIDFGNLYLNWNIVNEAARTGARMEATAASSTALTQDALQTQIQNLYNNKRLMLTMNPNPPSPASPLTVTVTEPVTIVTPLISVFFPSNPVTLTGKCIMQTEFSS